MMAVMTAQPPLPVVLVTGAVSIGEAVGLVEDADGGRVFLRGELVYAWSVGDVALRRLAAVQLVAIKAGRVADVAAAFGVDTGTLWRWGQQLSATGVTGLVPDKRGPKGPSRLTDDMVVDIRARRAGGASLRAIAAADGVSTNTVRRALPAPAPEAASPTLQARSEAEVAAVELPVLTPAASRTGELAAAHVARLEATNPDLLAVFYVDGHVRAYQGGRKVAKTHLSRLKFPAPATVETWVADASGDPVLAVMAEPGASLAMELRRLLPELRRAVGNDRRVLVGFDRGGWSPALFAHMHAQGFDVLTWRKGFAEDVDPDLFTDLTYVDETGRGHTWRVADTTVDLPIDNDDHVFTMRQVSLTVPGTKTGREALGQDATRQIHILTTRTDLGVEEVIYRMGSR